MKRLPALVAMLALVPAVCPAAAGDGPVPPLSPPVQSGSGAGAPATVEQFTEESGDWSIMGGGSVTADRLVSFLLENNPGADSGRVALLASLYVEEAAFEGVDSDVAFVQMCHETGFLRFGGLVTEEMNNFCGLGSTGPGNPGLWFPDERTGVRAHIQHLKAYGSTESLNLEQVDPRFGMVSPRGKSPDVFGLSGTWASDRHYGESLAELLLRLRG